MIKSDIVICPRCGSKELVKDGNKRGKQAYKCKSCRHRFTFGIYDAEKNKKIIESRKRPIKEVEFKLKDYEQDLQWTKSRIATNTAKKISKMNREKIEDELLNNVFKGNPDIDYGIIKILIYTNGWGIEKLLDMVFKNDNIHLNRFQIATISKHLAINIKYSWSYIKNWLYKYPQIYINRIINKENFSETHTRYENYQFIISRFFYKLTVVNKENIINYIGIQEIKNLVSSNYFKKFKKINFDQYGYIGDEISEIEYSLKKLIDRLESNNNEDDLLDSKLSFLGLEWEYCVLDILLKIYNENAIIEKQKVYENGCRSDFEIKTPNKIKIIECKLDAGNEELIETVIKYGRYCDEIEIWSLSDQYENKEDYKGVKINDVYSFLLNSYEYEWYKKSYMDNNLYNKNLKLHIYYLGDILLKINNTDLYNKIIDLSNLYIDTFGGGNTHISLCDFKYYTNLEKNIDKVKNEDKKRTLTLSHKKFYTQNDLIKDAEAVKVKKTLYLSRKKYYTKNEWINNSKKAKRTLSLSYKKFYTNRYFINRNEENKETKTNNFLDKINSFVKRFFNISLAQDKEDEISNNSYQEDIINKYDIKDENDISDNDKNIVEDSSSTKQESFNTEERLKTMMGEYEYNQFCKDLYIKIIKKDINIILKSKDLINFLSYLENIYSLLAKIQEIDYTESIDTLYNKYIGYDMHEIKYEFLKRYYERIKEKILKLKTLNGKRNCIENFKSDMEMEISKKYFTGDLAKCIDRYRNELESLI